MAAPPASFIIPSYRIGLPAYHSVEVDTCIAFYQLAMHYKAPMDVITACMVDMAREDIAKRFMEVNREKYLVFIDADMTFKPQDVVKLLWEMEEDPKIGVLGAICVNRDGSGKPVVKWIEGDKYVSGAEIFRRTVKYMKLKEVRGVDFMGTGFMVIRREVFEDVERPWFMAGYDEKKNFLGEDIYFLRKVKQTGKWKTCVDFGTQVGHVGKIAFYPDMLLDHEAKEAVSA
jgi:GT2 family glycosyltransferase